MTYDVKRWAHCAEEVLQHGIVISSTQVVAPYPGNAIVSVGKYFTPFLQTVTEFTKEIVSLFGNQDC